MLQLILHAIGDYLIQNDWMALNKKKYSWRGELACQIHCITYTLPFLYFYGWKVALAVYSSHYVIDRTNIVGWYLAVKNGLIFNKINPEAKYHHGILYTAWWQLKHIKNFGFSEDRPFEISIWLYIIVDNVFHIICNFLAIKYLS